MDSNLYDVISSGDIDRLKQLIAPPLDDRHLLHQMTPLKSTSLHLAVQFHAPVKFVEEICNRCPSLLMQRNSDGDTPLHIAAKYVKYNDSDTSKEMTDIVQFLIHRAKYDDEDDIERGKDDEVEGYSSSLTLQQQMIRMVNKRKDTALHEALRYYTNDDALYNDAFSVIELLLEADPHFEYCLNDDDESPLYLAVKNGLTSSVALILKTCPFSAHGGPGGRTALHAAALYRYDDDSRIVKAILEKRPDMVKEADKNGCSALHYAVFTKNLDMAVQLLDVDPSVAYMLDKDGRTVLHHAAASYEIILRPSLGIIKAVIKRCPDCWELLDNKGQNFLHVAVMYGVTTVIEYVLEDKSKMGESLLNRRDMYGNTPLQLALKLGSKGLATLIRKDDRVRQKDKEISMDEKLKYFESPLNTPMTSGEDIWTHEERMKLFDKERQTHMVVATLIATIAFAAGFTIPGGYNSEGPDKGMATLAKNAAFVVFMVSNTSAMLLSTFAVFINIWSNYVTILGGDSRTHARLVLTTLGCTFFAIMAMVVAFVTGTYVMLSHSLGLAIPLLVLGCSFFPFSFFIFIRILLWIRFYMIDAPGPLRSFYN